MAPTRSASATRRFGLRRKRLRTMQAVSHNACCGAPKRRGPPTPKTYERPQRRWKLTPRGYYPTGWPLRDCGIRAHGVHKRTVRSPSWHAWRRRLKTAPQASGNAPPIFGNKHPMAMPLYSKSAKSSSSGVSWSYKVLPLTIFAMPTR